LVNLGLVRPVEVMGDAPGAGSGPVVARKKQRWGEAGVQQIPYGADEAEMV